jgi:NAD dependent epimerase/dehydratase family enzyme
VTSHEAPGARVVITGGTGFLGQSLLSQSVDVVVLTRHPQPGLLRRQVTWDGRSVGEWSEALDGAAAVVNYTGRSVNCRYTDANLT